VCFSESVSRRKQRDRGEEAVEGLQSSHSAAVQTRKASRGPAGVTPAPPTRRTASCPPRQASQAAHVLLDPVVGVE